MKRSILIFCCTIFLSLCSCGDESGGNRKNDPQMLPDETSSIEENQNIVGFGGTISGDFFDISIEDAKWTDVLETSLYTVAPEKEGNKLLCLIFSAQNTSNETYNLGAFNAYVDKQAVLPTVVSGEIDGAMVFVGAVASGMEMKAYSVWELPENWEEFQLNYFEATGPECQQYFVIHKEDIGS